MCILESSELLMYEFYYDYNKNKDGNNSRLLFPDFDSLTYEITTEDLYEDYGNDKEMFDFSNYWSNSNYHNSSKLAVAKMKEETAGVAIKGFVGLTPKMCSYLVDDNSKHKKAKGINKNNVMSISHNEYKDVFFWMTNVWDMWWVGIKVKIIKNLWSQQDFLSCFDDKIYIQNNGGGLALGY